MMTDVNQLGLFSIFFFVNLNSLGGIEFSRFRSVMSAILWSIKKWLERK